MISCPMFLLYLLPDIRGSFILNLHYILYMDLPKLYGRLPSHLTLD